VEEILKLLAMFVALKESVKVFKLHFVQQLFSVLTRKWREGVAGVLRNSSLDERQTPLT
jgi:hypothetical protein